MAGRNQKDIYCFLQDINGMFYRASQLSNGTYVVTKNAQPYPIRYNPSNIIKTSLEFGTNEKYHSLARSISYTFDFIKDGAAIIREGYISRRKIEEKIFFTVVQWNGTRNLYELGYQGKIDFTQKTDDSKDETFSVSTIDDTAWGVLSQNDETAYSIDCSASNPKCIKVLFDGVTLLNKYTYQTVQAPITDRLTTFVWHFIPFVLINQDGDSAGILQKNQQGGDFDNLNDLFTGLNPSFFFYTAYDLPSVPVSGNYMFEWSRSVPGGNVGLIIAFVTSLGQKFTVFCNQPAFLGFPYLNPGPLIPGQIYNLPYNFNIHLSPGESIFFIAGMFDNAANLFTINPIVSNTFISTKTKSQSIIAYGLRAIDLLKALVAKATNNRFTINSIFFVENNKDVALSGDSIRGITDAKLYSSFRDFFETFDAIYYMALRSINGLLWMEKFIVVYKQNSNIFDIGSAIDVKTKPALEYYCNEIEVGSPDQDYRHPSGRLEYNSVNSWSIPIFSVNQKKSIITKYRTDCYGIVFLILDYQGQSSQDNSGDKTVFLVKITDELGMATEDIETFENINVDNAPLEPIIKSPFNSDVISYNKPVVRGIAPPGSNVNIYVDTVLDGNTVADADGNWSYNIVTALTPYVFGVTTGIHVIDATYTDLTAPVSTVTVTIDTSFNTATVITYPAQNDNLYNNIPLIKGVAQQGRVFDVIIDGVVRGTVTADESCRWQLKIVDDLLNGNHTLEADGQIVNFNVDTNVAYPLITYIGSELDGFVIINNLPLIKGVAIPGTVVQLWLNYIPNVPLGTAIADSKGDWEFQVVPVSYLDPLSGVPVIVAPIRNGLSVISTSLVNHIVGIVVTGFKLSRPLYSSITGVIDNTIFNTEYSPKRMFDNHNPLWSSILSQLAPDQITFQTSKKNRNLRTVLNDVVVSESANVTLSSLGSPFLLLENAEIKTKANKTFSDLLHNFNNGGIIKSNFRGTDLFFLPIGGMKINNLTSEVQEWKLLMSPLTSYSALLNLYKQGTTIHLMKNTVYHSDYNSLHFVEYDFQKNPLYNTKDIYEDWFSNRNDFWALNPDYIQKFNKSDTPFVDQIIVNGVGGLKINFYRCRDAFKVISFDYNPVVPAPISLPEIIMEANIDLTSLPEDQYFGVVFSGIITVAITERIQTKVNWEKTIRVESSSTKNKVGAFFSTGFRTILRVEGIVKKWQPSLVDYIATEENLDSEMLYSVSTRERIIRFGDAYGLPDYLYLKVALALAMNNLFVENVGYTLDPDEKIKPSDDVEAHPLYYYNVKLTLRENEQGKQFTVGEDAEEGVIIVLDAEAFGLPGLINIGLGNEP